MRDLHLWRLLQSRTLDPAATAPLLTELAGLPLDERIPFLGLLPPALIHADAPLRQAAVRVLGGALGRPALQKMVSALNDADEDVRRAAVEALRRSLLGGDWQRWVHVLFHPDAVVRLAAIAENDFPPPFLYKLYLLADPVCQSVVESQMAGARIGGEGLPLLFDFVRREVVPPAVARRLARAVVERLAELPRRSPAAEQRPHGNPGKGLAPGLAPGPFLALPRGSPRRDAAALLGPDPAGEMPSPHADFFDLLWEASLAEAPFFQQWVVFTMLGVAVQRQSWPEAPPSRAPSFIRLFCFARGRPWKSGVLPSRASIAPDSDVRASRPT